MKSLLKYLIFLLPLFFSSAIFAQAIEGKLEIDVFDYFKQHKSLTLYKFHVGKHTYSLQFPKNFNKTELLTGSVITVVGDINEDKAVIQVKSVKVAPVYSQTQQTDQRRLLVLLVNFLDKKATDIISADAVENQLYNDIASVKNNYLVNSSNQLEWISDANNDGVSDIYVVNLNYEALSDCNPSMWEEDAKTAAAAAGVDLSLYRHFMFILPQTTACPWGGLGNIGCVTTCNTWIVGWVELKGVMAHELGHNLGLQHAATDLDNNGTTDDEYGDGSCVMGSYYRQMNAPHRDLANWYLNYPKKIRVVKKSGRFDLKSLDISSPGLQVLKINKKDQTGTYYISYRTDVVPFGMVSPYKNRVNIHRTAPFDAHSWYITSLGMNESFVDSLNNIKVTVSSLTNDKAIVSVKI